MAFIPQVILRDKKYSIPSIKKAKRRIKCAALEYKSGFSKIIAIEAIIRYSILLYSTLSNCSAGWNKHVG